MNATIKLPTFSHEASGLYGKPIMEFKSLGRDQGRYDRWLQELSAEEQLRRKESWETQSKASKIRS